MKFIFSLLDQVPSAMATQAALWAPLIYGPLVHAAQMIRDRAYIAIKKGFQLMLHCQEVIAKHLSADLKGLMGRVLEFS